MREALLNPERAEDFVFEIEHRLDWVLGLYGWQAVPLDEIHDVQNLGEETIEKLKEVAESVPTDQKATIGMVNGFFD